jgi:outer membrane receptor protein involved in Fe transport
MLWIPEQTWLYAKYEHPLSRGLAMTFFSRYKLHQLADPTSTNIYTGYQNGKLGLADLSHEATPTWDTRYFYQSNTQLANELSFVYSGSRRLSAVGGVEIRNSSIQGNYVLSDKPEPAETGKDDQIPGGNRFNIMDLAVYGQLSYRLRPDLRAVVGGRLDNNRVRESKGYGSVLSPRLALIYTHRGLVLKGIYSEAFQDASNFQKYVRVVPSSVGNPDLTPERAKNVELSAGWQPSKSLAFEITAYDTRYSNIPQLQPVPCTAAIAGTCTTAVINQFQPVGAREIRGVQAQGSWTRGRSSLTANYTYTDPVNTRLGVRVGDIASHHFNLIGTAGLGEHFDVTARLNAVSARRTGRGTDVDANPNTSIPGYAVVNTALTWEDPLPHVSLQLLVENLLDRQYGDPGIRRADGITYAAEVPQPGRGIHLRLKVSF